MPEADDEDELLELLSDFRSGASWIGGGNGGGAASDKEKSAGTHRLYRNSLLLVRSAKVCIENRTKPLLAA